MSNGRGDIMSDRQETVTTSHGQVDDTSVAAYNHGHMSKQGENRQHMSQMDDMSKMEHMNMHKQYFSLKTNADFLLEGITISSVQGIVMAMLLTLTLSILIEILKTAASRQTHQLPKQMLTAHHLIMTLYHALSAGVGYILMFCVMTMNVWLLVSVVLGSGVGYLVVRPLMTMKLSRDGDGDVTTCGVGELEPLHDDIVETKLEHETRNNELTVNTVN